MDSISTTSWRKVGLVYLSGVVAALQIGVIAPIVPLLQHDLDLSLPFVGAILSCVTFVAVVFGTVAGSWTNRFGLVHAIAGGLALMAVAASLAALVDDGTMLLLIRAVAGLGYLMTVVACPPLIARIAAERDRAFALALWGSFLPVGIAIADAGAAVLVDGLGWRGLFWVDAAITGAMGLAAAISLGGLAPGEPETPATLGIWSVYRMRAPLLLMLCFGIFALTFIVFAAVEPSYLAEARGMPLDEAGRISALTTLAAIPGALMAGWLIRRGVSSIALAWVGLLAPALLSLAVFIPAVPITPVIVATVLALFLGGFVPAAIYALIPRVAPDPAHFAPVNGLLMQIGSSGTLIGPPLIGAWANALGWGSSPIVLIALGVVAIGCIIVVTRTSAPSFGHEP